MRDLPAGTVTFLFTDIEGSTKLLHELGAERYADALAEHRRVLRAAFAAHGGVEVDTQGDAFFVAFPRASDALPRPREARTALAAEADPRAHGPPHRRADPDARRATSASTSTGPPASLPPATAARCWSRSATQRLSSRTGTA